MKVTLLAVVFVVAASDTPEAAESVLDCYNEIYHDYLAYIALLLGVILNLVLGL